MRAMGTKLPLVRDKNETTEKIKMITTKKYIDTKLPTDRDKKKEMV